MAIATFSEYRNLVRQSGMLKQLLRAPCVSGIGVGKKVTAGKLTDQLALQVFVSKKVGQRSLPLGLRIPERIAIPHARAQGGVLEFVTDVCQASFSALEYTGRERPAPGGISIGHVDITTGTFGALVKDRQSGLPVILSNNHVLANSNDAAIGDPILQPGPHDGGTIGNDQIGTLGRFVEIDFSEEGENRVDAAVATPLAPWDQQVEWKIRDIGAQTPTEGRYISEEDLGQYVHKTGRTTEHTQGFIQSVYATVQVKYGFQLATFVDQIIISQSPAEEDFSAGGDSGSLVCDQHNRAVGLLFAGGEGTASEPATTIANPINFVMGALDLDYLTPDDVGAAE